RERRERTKQKAHDLYITVSNLCERSRRKIFNRQKELEACEDKEKFRMYGDLISANMYVLKKGSLLYTVNDFYTGEEVKISADPSLTPSQNAQKYYK
ncbi:NFACT family protein, partial [Acinetobacter baumannii]|nr:NFACT family protein [Acinetobacter baumannii]